MNRIEDFDNATSPEFLHLMLGELTDEMPLGAIRDVIDHEDFKFFEAPELARLSARMRSGNYAPEPLLTVEFPKSANSDRPMGTPHIEDALVYHALARFVQEKVDPKLSPIVRSNRLRSRPAKSPSKAQDLRSEEYWFVEWPEYLRKSEELSSKYRFALILDMAVYYENIDYEILASTISRLGTSDPGILNLLVNLLGAWAWRSPDGFSRNRGIPQDFPPSTILGNLYLAPVDQALDGLLRETHSEAVRWMDDYRVFVNDRSSAVRIARFMGKAARDVMLNLNESKTQILNGPFDESQLAETEFFIGKGGRDIIDCANKLIEKRTPRKVGARRLRAGLKRLWKDDERGVWGKYTHEVPYKRALTALRIIGDPYAIERCVDDLWNRPQLTRELSKYIGSFPNRKDVYGELLRCLKRGKCASEYQAALLVRVLGGMHFATPALREFVWAILKDSRRHWYLRCQATWLLLKIGDKPDFASLRKLLPLLTNEEEQRYCVVSCTPLEKAERDQLFEEASRIRSFRVNRLIAYMNSMASTREACRNTLDIVRQNPKWENFLFRLFLVRDFDDREVQKWLNDQLIRKEKVLRDPVVRSRISSLRMNAMGIRAPDSGSSGV